MSSTYSAPIPQRIRARIYTKSALTTLNMVTYLLTAPNTYANETNDHFKQDQELAKKNELLKTKETFRLLVMF
jgi:hypothetical protein